MSIRVRRRKAKAYWLSTLGGKWVSRAFRGEVKPPDGDNITTAHAGHRTLTVDTLIGADAWAKHGGQSVPEFKTYMHYEGRRVSTALPLVGKNAAPDVIFELENNAQERRVYGAGAYRHGPFEPVTMLHRAA